MKTSLFFTILVFCFLQQGYAQKLKVKCIPFRATSAIGITEDSFDELTNSSLKTYKVTNKKMKKRIIDEYYILQNRSSITQRSEADVRVSISIINSKDTTKIYFNKDKTFVSNTKKYISAEKDLKKFFKVLNDNKCGCDFRSVFFNL